VILKCTPAAASEHRHQPVLIEGDPASILVTEVRGETDDEVREVTLKIIAKDAIRRTRDHYPVLFGDEGERCGSPPSRFSGYRNPGDENACPGTRGHLRRRSKTARTFGEVKRVTAFSFLVGMCALRSRRIGAKIHLRTDHQLKPKKQETVSRVAIEIATLVFKKYRGIALGEHGRDGWRGEFLKTNDGRRIRTRRRISTTVWDPNGVSSEQIVARTAT